MAQTTGLVQRISILSGTVTCVWVGPTPANTEALLVTNDGSSVNSAFATSMIQALVSALSNYRAVTATHDDANANITMLNIESL